MECPHCGSKSQTRSTGTPSISDNGAVLTENFTCGCGTYFSAYYERNEVGAWEWVCTQTHFTDKSFAKKFKELKSK